MQDLSRREADATDTVGAHATTLFMMSDQNRSELQSHPNRSYSPPGKANVSP